MLIASAGTRNYAMQPPTDRRGKRGAQQVHLPPPGDQFIQYLIDADGSFDANYALQGNGPDYRVHLHWLPAGEPCEGKLVWRLEVARRLVDGEFTAVQEITKVVTIETRFKLVTTEWDLPYPDNVEAGTPCIWCLRLTRAIDHLEHTYKGTVIWVDSEV